MVMTMNDNDKTLNESGYEYRIITDLVPGDMVHRWADDLEILDVYTIDSTVYITANADGEVKTWGYKP